MKYFLWLLVTLPVWGSAQVVTTIAGNGTIGYSGDGGPATNAQLCREPAGVCVDNYGDVFLADWANNVVRKISTDGIITTVAGIGPDSDGYTGDGGPATNAQLSLPAAVLFRNNNLYICDAGNNAIRVVNALGIISTIAGTGMYGYNGDSIPATNAQLNGPGGMAFDNEGNLFFADLGNFRVRKINTAGIISTVAGTGISGDSGDGGPATSTKLNTPLWVAISPAGELYIADEYNSKIRKIDNSGIISTMAGNGLNSESGDNGPATAAAILTPISLIFDAAGNLYFGTYGSCRIREIRPSDTIFTYCGDDTCGFNGDGRPVTATELNQGVFCTAVDMQGNIYFSDSYNYRVRKITFDPASVGQVAVAQTGVSIFPNPAANTVTISLATGIASAEVLNALGRLVLSAQPASADKELWLDVSLLPAGMYLVKVNGLYTGRFVKE